MDNYKDLISVVIPVYNVEQYIHQCIDSVIEQTYKNIEIIIVDDGSEDRSGKICDEYAKKDERIKVIHQNNRGLSGARTAGQEIAQGKYITFIDSDDWIDIDMLEILYKAINKYNGDISCIGFFAFYEDGIFEKITKVREVKILNNVEALECYLFDEYITPCVWGKLWKRKLWKEIRCPEGKLFEDQYTTYKLLDMADKIILIPRAKYYYRKRANSIGHMEFNKRTYDLYYGVQEEYTYITQKYPQIKETLAIGRIKWEIVFINMMFSSKKTDKKLLRKCRLFARKNTKNIIGSKYIDWLRKGQMLLFAYNFTIYKWIYLKYKNRHSIR